MYSIFGIDLNNMEYMSLALSFQIDYNMASHCIFGRLIDSIFGTMQCEAWALGSGTCLPER